jgi:tetratricopeptide (TPR) repeat protein
MRLLPISIFLSLLVPAMTSVARGQDYLPELVRRIKPSAVAVETFDARGETVARGSGFFVSFDKVITNRHVIERASRVELQLSNGRKYPAKGVVAVDGEGDLALIQVDVPREFAMPLPIIQRVPLEGESVLVIGNPFGLEGSVSNGIVSAVREISGYGRIIQITAPISPGSSGSPVVNMFGQVIGVAALQAAEGQSLNFAIPSERIAQLRIGDLRSFNSYRTEAARNSRGIAESFYAQGLVHLSQDDFARALSFFERATQTDATYAEAWYQAGFCQGMLGRHKEALIASRQAAKLRPDWTETHINIGASHFALGEYRQAADAYREAARLDQNNADAHYALGFSLEKMGRSEEAVISLRRATTIRQDFPDAYEQLGVALFKSRRYPQSVEAFQQLVIYRPDANSYNHLGEALIETGKPDEAVSALMSALGYNPDQAKVRFNLGKAFLRKGDREAAEGQYEILKAMQSEWADRLLSLLNR